MERVVPDGMGLEYIRYEPFTGNFKLFEGKRYRITVNTAVSYEQYHSFVQLAYGDGTGTPVVAQLLTDGSAVLEFTAPVTADNYHLNAVMQYDGPVCFTSDVYDCGNMDVERFSLSGVIPMYKRSNSKPSSSGTYNSVSSVDGWYRYPADADSNGTGDLYGRQQNADRPALHEVQQGRDGSAPGQGKCADLTPPYAINELWQ